MKETASPFQILVIDKKGFIGQELIKFLLRDSEVIYVSESLPVLEDLKNSKFCFITYKKRFPEIPKITYSQIIVIYNGEKEVKEITKELLKAAEDIKARILFVLPLVIYNQKFSQDIIDSYNRAYVVVLGEIFNKDLILNSSPLIYKDSTPNKLFQQVYESSRIVIPKDGMEKTYPVFLEDVVLGIKEIVFKSHHLNRIFCLFPQHPLTILSIALMMKKIEPMIEVDFDSLKTDKVAATIKEIPENGEFVESSVPLKKRFGEVLLDQHAKKQSGGEKHFLLSKNTNKNYAIKMGILLIIVALFMPFILTIVFAFLGGYSLNVSKQKIESGSFSTSLKSAYLSHTFFQWAKGFSQVVLFEHGIVSDLIAKGDELAVASISLNSSLKYFTEYISSPTPTRKEDFQSASSSLMHTLTTFEKLKAENGGEFLNNASFDLLSSFTQGALQIAPGLIGFEKEKRYLILFQNNMELRPGGGFIGSYGMLTLKEGKIKDFIIHDVYDADGKLKGHVEPPYPIRRYLPSVHWYLRDSNFDIDFTKNASKAAFFLNTETGETVDGVIGVDVSFIKEILKAIGSIYVSEYNENVTADNLYLLTQSHAEKNFFPGSTQKKDFLRALFNAINLNLQTKNDESLKSGELYLKLIEAVTNSVSQKHIIFAFSNPSVQNLFTAYNMSSSLIDPRENDINTINDYLGISEANIGINKVNYFIKRKVDQTVIISDEGGVSGKATIVYKNLSTPKDWLGGDYKNYLRIVLPIGSKISSIIIDGEEQKLATAITDPMIYEAKNFSPPKGLEVETVEEEGKTVIGFLVTIQRGALKTVVINYDLSQKVNLHDTYFTYDLRYFKQPGTEDYPFSSTLVYPKIFKTIQLSDGLRDNKNRISFEAKLLKDTSLRISFSKP